MRRLLPHLVVTSVTLMLSSLLLFSFYAGSASRLMADKTADVLDASVTLFSRLQMASLPTFLGLTDEPEVRAFLRNPGLGKVGVYKALNRIDQVASSFDFLDSVYLSSPANGVLSTRTGWERLTGESDHGLAAVIDESVRGPSYSYVSRVVEFSHERAVPVWSLVVPLPNAGGAGTAAVVLNISSQKVRRQVETSRDASDGLVILSPQGSILTSPRADEVGQEFSEVYGVPPDPVLQKERGTELVTQGRERQMLSWVTQPELGWKFLLLTDEEQFLAPVRDIRNLAVLLSFALVAVSVALMLWITLRQERASRRNEVLLGFLSGTLESRDVLKATRALKAEGPWTAMVLRIDGARALADRERRQAFDDVRAAVTRHFDTKAVVLNVREGGVAFVDAQRNPPDHALETWNTAAGALEHGVSVQVFAESVSFSGLTAAFARIEPSLGRFFLLPHGSRVVAVPAANDAAAPLFLDGDLDTFEGALRHGDEHALCELFDRFRARLEVRLGDSTFPFWFQSLTYRAEQVFGPSFELTVGKPQSWFQAEVDGVETFDQARELFEGLARTAKARPVNATVKHLEVVRRVKELVSRHLNDRGFGTARLADETGFSVPYLREIFKHTEGQSLMAYISHSKLEEAKRLLSQTRLPISAICDRTGFLNPSYFFTYFRKIEGVTPTDYRLRTHAPTGDLP